MGGRGIEDGMKFDGENKQWGGKHIITTQQRIVRVTSLSILGKRNVCFILVSLDC